MVAGGLLCADIGALVGGLVVATLVDGASSSIMTAPEALVGASVGPPSILLLVTDGVGDGVDSLIGIEVGGFAIVTTGLPPPLPNPDVGEAGTGTAMGFGTGTAIGFGIGATIGLGTGTKTGLETGFVTGAATGAKIGGRTGLDMVVGGSTTPKPWSIRRGSSGGEWVVVVVMSRADTAAATLTIPKIKMTQHTTSFIVVMVVRRELQRLPLEHDRNVFGRRDYGLLLVSKFKIYSIEMWMHPNKVLFKVIGPKTPPSSTLQLSNASYDIYGNDTNTCHTMNNES